MVDSFDQVDKALREVTDPHNCKNPPVNDRRERSHEVEEGKYRQLGGTACKGVLSSYGIKIKNVPREVSPFDESPLTFVCMGSNHSRHFPIKGGADRLVVRVLERDGSRTARVSNYLDQVELFIPLRRKEGDRVIETQRGRKPAQEMLGDQPESLTSLIPAHGPSSIRNSIRTRLGVSRGLRFLQEILWSWWRDIGEVVHVRVFVNNCSTVFVCKILEGEHW